MLVLIFFDGFLWGGVLVVNQVEGVCFEGGKGLVMVDMIFYGEYCLVVKLGQEKCFILRDDEFYFSYQVIDFYYCYKDDIVLMVEMGFIVFCILIVWSWIYFNGDELILNVEGIVFYCDFFNECKKYNIELLVILCYFDVFMYLVMEYGLWCN